MTQAEVANSDDGPDSDQQQGQQGRHESASVLGIGNFEHVLIVRCPLGVTTRESRLLFFLRGGVVERDPQRPRGLGVEDVTGARAVAVTGDLEDHREVAHRGVPHQRG